MRSASERGHVRSGQIHPEVVRLNIPEISAVALQSLLHSCPYPVAKLDFSGMVEYVNPAAKRILFVDENPVGRYYWSLFEGRVEPDSIWKSRHYLAIEDNRPPPEFVEFFAPPINLWMAISVRPVSDGIFLFFRDITSEKNCADALQNTERLASLGRLSSTIVHEILNPLEAVTNLLYLAEQSGELGPVKEYVQLAGQEIERASLIVAQTLRFNRKSTQTSVVSCDTLLNDVLSLQKSHLASVHVKADTHAIRNVRVRGNEGEIRQIVVNLITNSIDAMSSGGGQLVVRARHSTRRSAKGVVITVADSGSGMSNETLKRSFEPFFTTKKDNGNGLGLWISRELAHKHGGTLKGRSSQQPGRCGSVFQLFLPEAA
jgi:signal transduction histidine kinase